MWNSSLLASRQERGLLNAFVWFLTKLSKFIKGRVAYLCEVDAVWQPLQSQTSKSPVIIVVFLLQIAKWLAFSEVLPCQKIIDTFENFFIKVPQSKALCYNFTELWWNAHISQSQFPGPKEQMQIAEENHRN